MKWRFVNDRFPTPFREDPYESLMEARSDAWMLQWDIEDGPGGMAPCTPLLENFVAECVQHIRNHGDPMYVNWAEMASGNGSCVTAARMCSQCVQELDREIGPFVRAVLKKLCEDARGVL